MDPNWFYSSLAQSAAAIVGIISALLLSKIQDIRKDGAKSRNELNREIEQWDKKKTEIITTVSNYGSYPEERPPVPWDSISGFNLNYNFKDLLHDDDTFNKLECTMKEFMNAEHKLYYCEMDGVEYAPHYAYYFKEDEDICKKILQWWNYTKYLVTESKSHNSSLEPINYFKLEFIIGGIFFFCVIIPLCYLDSYSNYSFCNSVNDIVVLLLLFTVGFVALLVLIFQQIQEIQKKLKI